MSNGWWQNVNYTLWCQELFNSLNDGGKWCIPRSGLIFTKRGEKLVLTDAAPCRGGLGITKERLDELDEQQAADYADTVTHFGKAGITVESEVAIG